MTAKFWLQCVLLIFCLFATEVNGFAAWMVNEFCDRLVQPGSVIMNEIVVQSNERQVLVHRSYYAESGEKVVELVGSSSAANSESKGVYYPGEELTVTVSDDKSGSLNTEYLFETSRSGGRFLGEERGCRHTRTNVNSQVLTMPPFKTDVRVWVGECQILNC